MNITWKGPFWIQEYLHNCISKDAVWGDRWPRERDAIYLVSEHGWDGQPTNAAHVLYVGER